MLELPGCQGIYYLLGKDNKSLSVTLWDEEKTLTDSRETVDRIRSETTAEQDMQTLDVEEFEVLTRRIKE